MPNDSNGNGAARLNGNGVAPSGQAAATWLDLDLKRAAAPFGP